MKTSTLVLVLIAWGWGCVRALPAGPPDDFKKLAEKFREGVVNVLVHQGNEKLSIGTGFLIDDRGTLITSAHVLDGAKAVFARFPAGGAIQCQLVDVDREHDLAAIRLKDPPPARPPPLVLGDRTMPVPDPLDEVLLLSNPKGLDFTPHLGRFSAVRDTSDLRDDKGARIFRGDFKVYQLDIRATHGSSGGPVLHRSGRVLGILAAGLADGTLGLNFCVPHSHVRALGLERAPRGFPGEDTRLRLESGFASTKLNYDQENAPVFKMGETAKVDFSSDHWGYVRPDAINSFIDDHFKAGQIIAPNHFFQLAQQNRLLHVVNAPFRFSVVVPEKFRLRERYDRDTRTFSSTFTDPIAREELTVTARRLDLPGASPVLNPFELRSQLAEAGRNFLEERLKLRLTPYPARRDEVMLGMLSDPEPRIGLRPGTVKFWRQYVSAPEWNTIHMVLFGINGDIFVAAHFKYRNSDTLQPLLPEHLVERMFLLTTLSFLE